MTQKMASFSRSALMAGFRSTATRSEVLAPKFLNSTHIFSSPFSSACESIPQASRILSALGKVESLKPLHRLNAPARIKSKGFLVKTSPQICVVIRSFTRGLAENQSAVLKPVPPPKTTNPHPKITITLSSFERPYLEDQLPGRRIRLPETRRLYTVLRSPHVHKKSREQFEIRTKKQCLVIQTTEKDEWKRKFFWLKNGRAFL